MASAYSLPTATIYLVAGASLVVLVAGLKAASPVLVPFLLSVFIAMIALPPMQWLQNKGLPRWLALTLVILAGLLLDLLLVALFGNTIAEFLDSYPSYNQRLTEELGRLRQSLLSHGIVVEASLYSEMVRIFDPSAIMQLVGQLFSGVSAMLTNAFFIFLTIVFILIEAPTFPGKLRRISRKPEHALEQFHEFGRDLLHYLGIKTIVSMITGTLIAVWLGILGVNFAILWGLLAFLFNYVPNIGSLIAAIPAVLLAFLQGGLQMALLTAGGYLAVNVLMGNILEPRAMGRRLGLSTLAVFLSLVFWGWVLGPLGMLLSVPLTMLFKAWMQTRDDTRWISVLLEPGELPEKQKPG